MFKKYYSNYVYSCKSTPLLVVFCIQDKQIICNICLEGIQWECILHATETILTQVCFCSDPIKKKKSHFLEVSDITSCHPGVGRIKSFVHEWQKGQTKGTIQQLYTVAPWNKTRPSYFYVYFIIAYSYFIYTTIYFRLIFSQLIAFLICPNLGYEPLKCWRNNVFRDGQFFSHMNYSLADLCCIFFIIPFC